MGGLDGPPKPPALGHASAEPWRASGLLGGSGGSEMAAAASRGGTSRPGWAGALVVILRVRTGLLEDGLELELAADRPVGLHGLEAGHGVVVDVAVGVEAPLAVDALEVLGGGDRLAQRLALLGDVLGPLHLAGGPLDRLDRHAASLRRVEGVGGRLLAELLLVLLVGLGPDSLH